MASGKPFAFKIVLIEFMDGRQRVIKIVRREDVDPLEGHISRDSPLGEAIMTGNNEYQRPDGQVVRFKILKEGTTK